MTLQERLFRAIQSKIPEFIPLELELAKVTGKDTETVFKWVRGLAEIPLNDAYLLAQKFDLSLGTLGEAHPSIVSFRFQAFGYNLHTIQDYFEAILQELKNVDVIGPKQLFYAANDFPVFSLFQFPELAAFKLFFWGKEVYHLPAFAKRKFDLDEINTSNLKLGEKAWRKYLKMPSVEIWSSDIVNNGLKQVFFAWRNGIFAKKEDALLICDQIMALLDHSEKQAGLGRKFHPDNYPPKRENFQLFYNEVAIVNNSLLFKSEDFSVAFVIQETLNYLVTDHPTFCLKTEMRFKQLLQKSTPISIQNEELRTIFFQKLRENVAYVKGQIEG